MSFLDHRDDKEEKTDLRNDCKGRKTVTEKHEMDKPTQKHLHGERRKDTISKLKILQHKETTVTCLSEYFFFCCRKDAVAVLVGSRADYFFNFLFFPFIPSVLNDDVLGPSVVKLD